jgi:hypothetical protein
MANLSTRITRTHIPVGTREWGWRWELASPGARGGGVIGAIAIGATATSISTTTTILIGTTSTAAVTEIRSIR